MEKKYILILLRTVLCAYHFSLIDNGTEAALYIVLMFLVAALEAGPAAD